MAPSRLSDDFLDFDLDRYLNPFVPPNRLDLLPRPIAHFLGYRSEPAKEPYTLLQWPITFLAIIAGLCLVSRVGNYAAGIQAWHPPVIIASLGASAVLDFSTIRSPLAQPRNAVIGNTLSAIGGVAVCKLFRLHAGFDQIQWVAAAVGCALASWLMSLTNTIHPPGGATAVIACTQRSVIAMGWRFVPMILLDSVLLTCVALLFNNLMRQYPLYWWSPSTVGQQLSRWKTQEDNGAGEGRNVGQSVEGEGEGEGDKKTSSDTASDPVLPPQLDSPLDFIGGLEDFHICSNAIRLPRQFALSEDEVALLRNIQQRLRRRSG